MRRISVMVAVVLWGAAYTGEAQANLLEDGSFALATHDSQDSNTAWQLTGSSLFRQDNWAQFDGPMGVWWRAFEGDPAGAPVQGKISQKVGSGGGTPLATASIDLNLSAPKDGSWNQYQVQGVAPAGTTAVRVFGEMVDGVNANANPQSAMFDTFDLTEAGGTYTLTAYHKAETNYTSASTLLGIDFLGVPEPTSLTLGGAALFALLSVRRKR